MGSALVLCGFISKAAGWPVAWLSGAGLTLAAAAALVAFREKFAR